MSKKGSLLKFQNITDGDMSAAITSVVTALPFLDNIGIQLNVTTSDAVGTFQVQVSADHAQDSQGVVSNAGHWIPLTLSGTPTVASADTDISIDINELAFPWIRVVYVRTSGSGTVQGFITAKGLA